MTGFDTEDKKKAEFAIGAYVETSNAGIKEYAYLQKGEISEGEKYAFISYNDFFKA